MVHLTISSFSLWLWHARFRILPHSLSSLIYKYIWGPCMICTVCTHIKSIKIIFTAHLLCPLLSHHQSQPTSHAAVGCDQVQHWNFPLCIFIVFPPVSHKNAKNSRWNSQLKLVLHRFCACTTTRELYRHRERQITISSRCPNTFDQIVYHCLGTTPCRCVRDGGEGKTLVLFLVLNAWWIWMISFMMHSF